MIPIRAWGATARKVARTASSAATREDGRVCCSGSLNRRAIAANISKLLRSLNKPPDRLRPRLQDGARRHRVEAQGLHVSLGALAGLAQNEELGCTGREARGGRGLDPAALGGGPEPDGAHFFQFTFFSLVSLMSPL